MTGAEIAVELQRTRTAAAQAMSRAKAYAFGAGQKMKRAVNAGANLEDQVKSALLARDAYWQRISAEGEKYRATYLLLAAKEREVALNSAMTNAKNARDQRYIVERTKGFIERANLLEAAAKKAAAAVKNVPEPEVVSLRRAQRLANAMGTDLSRQPGQPGQVMSQQATGVTNFKLYNPLVNDFYTEAVRNAASGLRGFGDVGITPGDGTDGSSLWDSLKRALGVGVSEASKAATKAGQDAAKENPGTAVAASAAGGVLAAISSALGVSFQQGADSGQSMGTDGERKFPWGAVAAVAAVAGAGYLVWRAR